MLILDNVYLGHAPYGASAGSKAISLYFIDNGEQYPENLDKKEYAAKLIDTIDEFVKEKSIDTEWANSLISKIQMHFYGDCLSSSENVEISTMMFESLHRISLELQKSVAVKALRPPFMVYHCTPKNYTGKTMFYENFNVIQCTLDLQDPDFMNNISPLACVEINNHNFSVYILHIKSMDDFKKWEEFDKNKLAEISHDRVFVYDHTSNDDVWNYALENGFRYFIHSEKTKNLPFYK